MRQFHYIAIAAAAVAGAAAPADHQADNPEFVVSPSGNDSASGDSQHPFATLARAQRAARSIGPSQSKAVRIRAGTYELASTLRLGAADANTTWEAVRGERVVISGGRAIHGFRTAGGRWETSLPDVASGNWFFQQLFVNGTRRQRPRLPQSGYYFIAADGPNPRESFHFSGGEIRSEWAGRSDLDVLVYHTWMASRQHIATVGASARLVQFTAPTLRDFMKLSKGQRFVIENVREALGEPGQFYLDRKSGMLTYIPEPGERPDDAAVVAPRLDVLIELDHTHDVLFRGITFAHTNWVTPPEGYSYSQAEAMLPGAIRARYAERCGIESCRVEHTGAYAIEWGEGSRHNRVIDCELTDLGAGGIKVGDIPPGMEKQEDMAARTEPERVAGYTEIRNNSIAHGGRIHPAGVGIWVGHSPYNIIEHNDVFDLFYTGIAVGWIWGFNPNPAHHNRIEFNRVYDVGQHVLSDVGGIYTLGVQPGTVIRNNIVHGVYSYANAGRGIYLDEGSSEILVENNLVYDTSHELFVLSYGRGDIVRNNIFALSKNAQFGLGRATPDGAFTFEHNIVYWRDGPIVRERWPDSTYSLDSNCYWNGGRAPIVFGKRSWAAWQNSGQDRHTIIADPLFVNPDSGDFRLRPDSPVAKIRFQPFDITLPGRTRN